MWATDFASSSKLDLIPEMPENIHYIFSAGKKKSLNLLLALCSKNKMYSK